MEHPKLKFDRGLCNECACQSRCKIGKFSDELVLNVIEPETNSNIIEPLVELIRLRIYDAIHGLDQDALDETIEAMGDEYRQALGRNERLHQLLDGFLAFLFSASDFTSEKMKKTLMVARDQFVESAQITQHPILELENLVKISSDAKLWRDDDQCLQDDIQ